MFRYVYLLVSCLFISGYTFAQQPEGRYYTAPDGVKIYYEINGTGYPVILLHGFANTSANWLKTATYADLVKAGYQVIVPDMRGNGRSDAPAEEGYTREAQVKDIAGLASSLHIKSYDVIGYSRGTTVAAKLLTMDKRIHKAVLGGMSDLFTNPQWDRPKLIYRALTGDTSLHEMREMVDAFNSRHYNLMALAYQQKYQPVTTPAEFAKVHIPVLVLRGTEDVDAGSTVALQKMIPGAQLKLVPGDHNHAYNTQPFADAILSFLK